MQKIRDNEQLKEYVNAIFKDIFFFMILFLSVSDYSQSSLTKSSQHGTYDYLFNLTYFYSRDRVQVSEF